MIFLRDNIIVVGSVELAEICSDIVFYGRLKFLILQSSLSLVMRCVF